MPTPTRRRFLRQLSAGLLTTALLEQTYAETLAAPQSAFGPNDRINLVCIGLGIQGHNDIRAALQHPGIELVGVCDLYTGRLERAREVYGAELFVTRDYRELLSRPDVDAVIVATPDHWHDTITIAALDAGKHVYCEKPMVQQLDEGHAVLEAEQRNPGVLIVGSQRVSSILTEQAREIYRRGDLGQLVLVETFNDRFSALGAWQYSIPRDASPETVDWDTFLKDTGDRPFDAKRFFRWRNYRDYGTGVAGDLFVHLFSGAHRILDSMGPERIFSTGGLRYWNDGRDVPDVFIASCDYGKQAGHPAFNMQLRVNFVDGGGGGSRIRFVGTEGSLDVTDSGLTLQRKTLSDAPGYGGWDAFGTFSAAGQEEFKTWYQEQYPPTPPAVVGPDEWNYRTPEGYSDHVHHFGNWFEAIRGGGKVVQDGAFGFRAAAPSLAANTSYFERKIVEWDPETMQVV
ncbi:Inositol 2-dehydrogenase/D-chiro-inositol 3-dehydrogenase [Neolewinella maritima]|uniref:Inositol 2-dehydrogenase/D-chiro-inositol 3-dehydrogenase n=1 Tax=Neolewinella maritima TaxID=1383882 RepID=A0ABN8F6U2_9BACT|nr:Gfo/Idh/MocA family oxidoreductase [Neolewinella maritima]CAH1000780.1 Inositol 2-dehydrogenase/D-chiro-inositol 3-dehydrogenase [Neolewinella maritima]